MSYKTFIKLRILIGVLIAIIVAVAATINDFYLAITGVLIGVLFMFLVKSKFKKVIVDERVIAVSGKASRMTYVIVTLFLAIAGLFLILSGRGDGNIYVESIGVLFSYLAMLLIAVYSISYHYFNKKYGGDK
ncbi:DUF2178 domain-containing protein [Patescibacteria group bacterium]|nr:DUF2178 domain-containing protein [Patescibacteria group bacterium]